MAWQPEVGAGSNRATTYHDLVTKLVAFATSQHVATVAINAAGLGYVAGDILTLTHAGAYLDARFEVLTVGGAGDITSLRIVSSGAFADRIAAAAVVAGGANYAVGDILLLTDGAGRERGKCIVATLAVTAVATVNVFETGGAYLVPPGAASPTVGVGPSTFAGDNNCTLTAAMTGLIGLAGLAATGGTGAGATVDITLAETGWTVDSRNTNIRSFNGVTNEKEVVLVGDATGMTNKPYIGLGTLTRTSGINTRYAVAFYGLITHNPALALSAQVGMRGDPGTWSDGNAYLVCNQDQVQPMDFWFTIDEFRVAGIINNNPGAANTDDGQYLHFYHGFMNAFATEYENPYPMLVAASARATNIDPGAGSTQITGLSELAAPAGLSCGCLFYRAEDATWVAMYNSQNLSTTVANPHVMAPVAYLNVILATGTDVDAVVNLGPLSFYIGIGSTGRAAPTRRLFPVPGAVGHHFPIPLTVLSRPGGTTLNQVLDTARGQLRGFFWVYNTDSAGATINNFSEDYVTIGTDRYRIFHTHVQRQLYHFIAILEDV